MLNRRAARPRWGANCGKWNFAMTAPPCARGFTPIAADIRHFI
jgi:hypothetical protein